jgi:aspartyl/asparaginyl-tRNA synthetase
MKIRFIPCSLLAFVFVAAQAGADTITLKDGKVLEGKILKTEGDNYVIEYQVTKSIKDVKKVPKADVAKIVEIKLDDKAFEAIAKLVPTPDLLTADEYAERMQAVKAFLTKFPTGTKKKEAEAILKTLTDEAAKVAAGGRKFDGMMVSGTDYRANAYDMVVNGVELGGGSIRIHDSKLQNRMFELLGFTPEKAEAQFGFLMSAFRYGAPPHGGLAFGLDRFVSLFAGLDSIRDCIAFPKNNSGRDVMIDAPSVIDQSQLDELNLVIDIKNTESK